MKESPLIPAQICPRVCTSLQWEILNLLRSLLTSVSVEDCHYVEAK